MSLRFLQKKLLLSAMALGLSMPGAANALDIFPGDYTALPSGTTLGVLYFGHSGNSDLRVGNVPVPDSKYDLFTSIPRVLHYSDIAGVPIAVQAFLPFGAFTRHRIGGANALTSDGVGDLTTGFTVFPLSGADKQGGTTVGLTAYVSAPTGNYSAIRPLNIGSGTWQFFPQLGVIHNLGNGFFVDLAADVTFFNEHREFGLNYRQDESFQVQAYLRKNFTPTTFVAGGYSGRFGGKQYVSGIDTGLKTEVNSLRVFAGTFVTPTLQISAVGGLDISRPEGGFRNDYSVQIRLLNVFPPPAAAPAPVVTKY